MQIRMLRVSHVAFRRRLVALTLTCTVAYKTKDIDVRYRVVRRVDWNIAESGGKCC